MAAPSTSCSPPPQGKRGGSEECKEFWPSEAVMCKLGCVCRDERQMAGGFNVCLRKLNDKKENLKKFLLNF